MVFYGILHFTKFRTEEAYAEGMSAKNGWNVKLRIGQGLQGPWRSLTFLELVSLALDIYRRFRSVDQSKKMSSSRVGLCTITMHCLPHVKVILWQVLHAQFHSFELFEHVITLLFFVSICESSRHADVQRTQRYEDGDVSKWKC